MRGLFVKIRTPDGKLETLTLAPMKDEEYQKLLTDHAGYLEAGSPRGGRYKNNDGTEFTLSFEGIQSISSY